MDAPDLPIGVTGVRVPVLRAHAMVISVTFDEGGHARTGTRHLADAPGLRLMDYRSVVHFPMSSEATERDEVLVGRIRTDLGHPSGRTLALFVAGKQFLKGVALNAMQIAELLPKL